MVRTSIQITLLALLTLVIASGCEKSALREESFLPPTPEMAGSSAADVSAESAAPAPEAPPPGTGAEVMATAAATLSSADTTSRPGPGMRRIHFDFDQAALRPDAREILLANAEHIRATPETRVQLEGHCDERGTMEYNLALGERRAMNVFQYLVDLGLDPGRFDLVSFGKEKLLVPGHNESAWEQNRRVEFVELSD